MALSHADLADLARDEGDLRVTLCAETDDRAGDGQKTAIKLKNTRAALADALAEAEIDAETADAVVAPLDRWMEGRRPGPIRGAVAAFLSPEGGRVEEVAHVRREGAWAGRAFRLAPVWPDPERRIEAAALVADEGGARLLRLRDGALEDVPAELPGSLEDFLGPKEIEGSAGGRMNQPGRQGDAFGETHRQEQAEERDRYAGALARAAEAALAGSGLPLVIVADEAMQGRIRAVTTYPDLCAATETRHPSSFDAETLAEAVAEAARPALERRRAEAVERVEAAIGRGDPSSENPDEILTAAREGRVALLLFDPRPAPGDAETRVAADETPLEDRVDEALRLALATGAELHAVSDPARPLRAVYRY